MVITLIVHKACLEICMLLKGNYDFLAEGGGGGGVVVKDFKHTKDFWRKFYPGTVDSGCP
jgi:hypothetical protein